MPIILPIYCITLLSSVKATNNKVVLGEAKIDILVINQAIKLALKLLLLFTNAAWI